MVSEMMLENIISSITHLKQSKDDEKSRPKKKKADETLHTK